MASAFKGDLNLLKLLLTYGGDIKLKNNSNMTLRDWALMLKRDEVLKHIENLYGKTEAPFSRIKNLLRFTRLGLQLMRTKFSHAT